MNKHPEGWQFRYDHEYKIAMAVDAFDGNYMVWIGYDNEISAIEKVKLSACSIHENNVLTIRYVVEA